MLDHVRLQKTVCICLVDIPMFNSWLLPEKKRRPHDLPPSMRPHREAGPSGQGSSGSDGNHGKIMGKSWENHGKIMGKSWENHGKIMGKSWESDWKMPSWRPLTLADTD